ncbi:MAG: hypothetical protein K6F63_08055 [Lachnospiraceae bacterium]|nr:hypothetical protein [Lachnospiraceae bacterium]
MIVRHQYRCSFNASAGGIDFEKALEKCGENALALIKGGRFCNISFYRYEDMGFLHLEEISENEEIKSDPESICPELKPFLNTWPEEDGDRSFVPMIKVYYQYEPEEDLNEWEKERATAIKTRVGRIAFVFPSKLTSYIMYHKKLTDEGLNKGDKYAYISMHENILFSYYEEPRNNVNISRRDEASKVIDEWLKVDPESHFDRVKAKGMNFLVIPCLFTADRVDLKK